MSWVANLILVGGEESESMVREFSDWLETEAPLRQASSPAGTGAGVGSLQSLVGTAIGWGGWKMPECRLWGGALNHADLAAVVRKFGDMPWESPGSVQLLLMDQEQSYFRLWMIRNGRPHEFTPPPDPTDQWSY